MLGSTREFPDPRPDDRQVLVQWPDWQRATVRAKCEGVPEDAARRSWISTSPKLTMARIVVHLTDLEHTGWSDRSWASHCPTGRPTGARPISL